MLTKRTFDRLCFTLAAMLMIATAAVLAVPAGTSGDITDAVVRSAEAADHTDAPLAQGNPSLDINDVYLFRRGDNLVAVMTVRPFVATVSGNLFDNNGLYRFYIDNTGDNTPEFTVTFSFSGAGPQQFNVDGLGVTLAGDVTSFSDWPTPIVVTSGGISAFCGPTDDPFFFDLVGFNAYVGGLGTANEYTPDVGLRDNNELNGGSGNGSPADTFAGANVCSIVLELPITAVNGTGDPNTGSIRAWAKTFTK